MCSLKPYHQKIETLSQLVDIIVHEVEEGKLMLEIVAFVKEQEIVEECQYELEKSISLITEQICNAKSIKKEELLDTLKVSGTTLLYCIDDNSTTVIRVNRDASSELEVTLRF